MKPIKENDTITQTVGGDNNGTMIIQHGDNNVAHINLSYNDELIQQLIDTNKSLIKQVDELTKVIDNLKQCLKL